MLWGMDQSNPKYIHPHEVILCSKVLYGFYGIIYL